MAPVPNRLIEHQSVMESRQASRIPPDGADSLAHTFISLDSVLAGFVRACRSEKVTVIDFCGRHESRNKISNFTNIPRSLVEPI